MTPIITRTIAINNLKKHLGENLKEWANKFGITIYKNGKQNKGWKGLVLERLAGLTNNNDKAPNGLGFELKSVAFYSATNKPKETMAITMINPNELLKNNFFNSHCWKKLKSLVFCAVEWNSKNADDAKLLSVASMDFNEDGNLIKEIAEDYELIRNKLKTQGFSALTGKDGKWIQARTKGVGHGSISRAFYARKKLIAKILPPPPPIHH
jgi:DNA mismatch repair protein MutH